MSVEQTLIQHIHGCNKDIDSLERHIATAKDMRDKYIWVLFFERTGLNKGMVIQDEQGRVGVIREVGCSCRRDNPGFNNINVQLIKKNGEVGGNSGYFNNIDKVKKLADTHEEYFEKFKK